MSTELALIENGEYDAAVMAMLGFGRPGGNMDDGLTRLKINFDHVVEVENEDGTKEDVSVVAGCFMLYKDGEFVYSMKNPVTLRVFMQRFDYRKWDEAANDGKGGFTAHSILANNGEEPIDDQGGIACGKVRGKAAKGDLSPEQKKIQKEVSSFRVIYGTVSFKGRTVTGKDVDIEDLPVQMHCRGNNYMPIGDALKDFEKRKIMPMTVPLSLKTRREKNGATTYYIIEYSYDVTKRVSVTKSDIELVGTFNTHIKTYNDRIREAHTKAIQARNAPPASDNELDDDFGEEPDDSGTEID